MVQFDRTGTQLVAGMLVYWHGRAAVVAYSVGRWFVALRLLCGRGALVKARTGDVVEVRPGWSH